MKYSSYNDLESYVYEESSFKHSRQEKQFTEDATEYIFCKFSKQKMCNH